MEREPSQGLITRFPPTAKAVGFRSWRIMKISIRQAQLFYAAVKNMGIAGVSAKGVHMLDFAMNKAKIEPMILAYEKMVQDAQELVAEYNKKIAATKKEDVAALQETYAKVIKEFEERQKDITETLNSEKDIDLIMIKKTDLIIKEDNGAASECLFGLLPCLE